MPHFYIHRPRNYRLDGRRVRDNFLSDWERINALCYIVGGIFFVIGSIFYYPYYLHLLDSGCWSYLVGSIFYLIVNLYDCAEVVHNFHVKLQEGNETIFKVVWNKEFIAAVVYLCGTLLFILGCLLNLIDLFIPGGYCFIYGSIAFLMGAIINVLQLGNAINFRDLQLLNITAISFIVGSSLFLVASVPYLWSSTEHSDLLLALLAWQYLVASLLFLVGGFANAARVQHAHADAVERYEMNYTDVVWIAYPMQEPFLFEMMSVGKIGIS